MKKKMQMVTALVIFAVIMLAGPASALAQTGKEKSVDASVFLEPTSLTAGGQGRLKIKLHLMEDAHVNANVTADPNLIPTIFTPKPTAGITWGKPEYPEPAVVTEWYALDPLSVYQDGAIITVSFTIDKSVVVSQLTLGGVLQAQACDHEQCYPPRRIQLAVQLNLQGTTQAKNSGPPNLTNAQEQAKAKTQTGLSVGAQVPEFSFVDFAGKPRQFSEFRGHYVLLDFWATWCSPCLADMPRLRKLYDKYQSRSFDILGLDSETLGQDTDETDQQTQEQAKKVAAAKGAVWTHATAATAVPVANKVFNVQSLPTKILIDREGKVVAWVKEKDDLDAMLAKLLAKD